jgi:hypothetical protein
MSLLGQLPRVSNAFSEVKTQKNKNKQNPLVYLSTNDHSEPPSSQSNKLLRTI